ncbi:methyltransferase domain-containing protein [Candidatus Woesearchaeota archaeon]|nr:methyltransferase domain-containing protein [Candidatus Woesearchaeota archaeon]
MLVILSCMLLSKTLKFYKRREVQRLLVHYSKNREVAIRFEDYFGKRPDTLMYEADVLELAKKKASSFHCSEELWSNPLQINSSMKKQDLDALRVGWDLILDIDCHHFVYSKIATHLLIKILKDQGISCATCKFSGNKGFHIGVPFEAFPDEFNGKLVKDLFPEAPRKIAFYLRDKLRPLFEKAILKYEKNDINNIVRRTGIAYDKLVVQKDERAVIDDSSVSDKLMVDEFLEIDTVLIASRHLYRMPFSLHEKSELVSVPVNVDKILKFRKSDAEIDCVSFDIPFLDRSVAVSGEAGRLFVNAYDFNFDESKISDSLGKKEFKLPEEAIREELFPPCIKNAFLGVKDGKKRLLFTLVNFLRGCGWDYDAIDKRLNDWNKLNAEPLRQVYLNGQLRQLKKNKGVVPPHNCKRYYQDLQVCTPDSFCSKIKNPLQYSKLKFDLDRSSKGKSSLTKDQLEARNKDKIIADFLLENFKKYVVLSKCSLLDVGCGDGKKSRYLSNKLNSYVGLELDANRVKQAKSIVKKKNVSFANCDFFDFVPDNKFSCVSFIFSWHYFKDFSSVLKKLNSVLAKEGFVFILEASESTSSWKSSILRKNSKDFDEAIFSDKIASINVGVEHILNQNVFEIVSFIKNVLDGFSLFILKKK